MTQSETPEVDLAQVADAGRRAVVVDVREPDEYAGGHVPGARLMPMGRLASTLGDLDRSAPIYVICASGNRSKAMTDVLRGAGFDAHSVAGGTRAWIESGRPVETGLS
ncbi:MAG TPA: rhodanese-like domain-containing protein [Nocardioidaceae bacterium]|jgi:rhodanese-related sulfurtransferase|nr:rhodanese-like domain-containing protein [Nocardioidaceae bacterium]